MGLFINLKNKMEMITTRIKLLFLNILMSMILFTACSVGALVNIKARKIEHPVSHTNNFYDPAGRLIGSDEYSIQKEFSITFTKWGISSLIDIEREEDISDDLNDIITENDGDAIVDLTVSVANSPINGFTFFTKVISFWGAAIFTPLAIIESSRDYAFIAAGSILIYIFTPAAADIKLEGKVVKIIK